jgi:oxygen-independent coproporphyrinogen-3 oxidase
VALARAAGFDSHSFGLNLDLIFAVPHQTMPMWQASLLRVLALAPEHLSLYALSLEHGTPLRSWVQRGLLPAPDPDLAAEMYGWAAETLAAHGYEQYEISNWSRRQKSEVGGRRSEHLTADFRSLTSRLYQCRHNLQYWRNLPYLGFGAGAHGCASGFRYANVLAPAAYTARLENGAAAPFPFSPATVERTRRTTADEMNETMMLGLRLTGEGVSTPDFEARFGVSLEAQYSRTLRYLAALALIEWDGARVRLTPAGRLLGNRVFREFV